MRNDTTDLIEAERYALAEINHIVNGVWAEKLSGGGYGIFMGSHGGRAERLVDAMTESLSCCALGEWWCDLTIDHERGRLLKDHFREIANRHLGGIVLPLEFIDEDDEEYDEDAT